MINLIKKLQLFYVLFGVFISVGVYYIIFEKDTVLSSDVAKYTFEEVRIGDITSSINVLGKVELVEEQALRFSKAGQITHIFAKEGENIKAGAILASLDKTSANLQVEQQRLNLENAKLKLDSLYSVDESKLLDSQRNIQNTKDSLEINKKELEIMIQDQKNSLGNQELEIDYKKIEINNAINSLEDLKKQHEILLQELIRTLDNTHIDIYSTFTNLLLDFDKDVLSAEESIETMDLILGVSDKNKNVNNSFEIYLSARNSQYKNLASNHLSKSISLLSEIKKLDKNDYINFIKALEELYNEIFLAADSTYRALDNSVESSTFTASEISSKKSSISSLRSKIQSTIGSIAGYEKRIKTITDIELLSQNQDISIKKSLDNIASQELNIDKLKNQLDNLETNLSKTKEENTLKIQNKINTISNLEKQLEIQEKTYSELLAGPTRENILSAQNDIKRAELNLSETIKDLDNYELRAPFDGVIRKIDIKVGDNLENNSTKYIYIENPNLVEIPILLDQIDIVKVSLGQKANIKFDAYPTQKVSGEINIIDFTPIEQSGVVNYTIKVIILDSNFDKKILSGMTAEVEIITNQELQTPFVSNQSLQTQNNQSFVRVFEGQRVINIPVEIGISAGGRTQILSGVEVGTQIILSEISTNSSTPTTQTSTTLFPTGAGMGGGGGGGGAIRMR